MSRMVVITLEGAEAEKFVAIQEQWGTRIIAAVDEGWDYLSIDIADSEVQVLEE